MTSAESVDYDRSLKIMMASPSTWGAAGASQWFDNYRIASVLENPLADKVGAIDVKTYLELGEAVPKTAKDILESKALARLLATEPFAGYRIILNRPSSPSARTDFLGNDYTIARNFENKVWLREKYADVLRFPRFVIASLELLTKDESSQSYVRLQQELGADNFVIQHQSLSGGRGTYVVRDYEQFRLCVTRLGQAIRGDGRIVISELLTDIRERSLQGCVTTHEVLVGPPQAQLVGHSALVSAAPGAIQFCGGRITDNLMTEHEYREASGYVKKMGQALREHGYRGIFGMDFISNEHGLHTLEVNPRMTGLTTLLAFLQTSMPLLLVHFLEVAGSPYRLKTPREAVADQPREGSFLAIFAQKDSTATFATGIYDKNGRKVAHGFEKGNILPESGDHYFVGMKVSPGKQVPAGKSLAFIYSRRQLFDDDGLVDAGALQLAAIIRAGLAS